MQWLECLEQHQQHGAKGTVALECRAELHCLLQEKRLAEAKAALKKAASPSFHVAPSLDFRRSTVGCTLCRRFNLASTTQQTLPWHELIMPPKTASRLATQRMSILDSLDLADLKLKLFGVPYNCFGYSWTPLGLCHSSISHARRWPRQMVLMGDGPCCQSSNFKCWVPLEDE